MVVYCGTGSHFMKTMPSHCGNVCYERAVSTDWEKHEFVGMKTREPHPQNARVMNLWIVKRENHIHRLRESGLFGYIIA